MLNWHKYWYLIINVISFLIAMIDGFVWRDADIGFPIFTILGTCVSSIIGGFYQLFLIIKTKSKTMISELVLLWFTAPFYGVLGAILGLLTGFTIF